MRWICKDEIEECLTQAWKDMAEQANAELIAAPDEEARKAILRRVASSNIWREFYKLLPEPLKRKCWYCEAEEIRSDMPVDHFRPKNKVEDDKQHDGYWWLAFDWQNYRCACTFCNSRRVFDDTEGGKACRFPLENPDERALVPADQDKLNNERPYFLDPFNPDDEKLLWFDNDGLPLAKPSATVEQQTKVQNSIEIFHLHESRIVRARNIVRLEVERQVRKIKTNDNVQEAKAKLRRMVRDTEKLSRAAVVYLRAHRELPEVKDILNLD
ncbi:TPA: HNH endonuclease [Salmonella enterica subsp. enterica serovar Newport]|uniref:HNH endonuclease n=2 Tax=Salmonella enterica TaxID=28901 RepID=A0A722AXN9_SALER|nr:MULTISPECIES: HNH endonuclease [Enterobacteriaceae]EAW7975260.1 HNH endonuclease [Salmonella enterica]EBT6932864.1 HNH endonuclease [Salmonella enterica]ECG6220617.1 HNH endonuclease [Salmonella enterica subsp. enterica serovar Newport]ECY9436175.1 HNH endonuclease [Salmonella enterica subsp. enterica serovar Newport]EEB5254184.1 HNH endonuclease [Salmonella enterica subsp. enterica serovar Newport]